MPPRAAPTTDVRAAPATDVRAAPANDLRAAPANDLRAASATDVKATPATDVRVAPATDVRAAPANDMRAANDVRAAPETDVRAVPATDVRAAPTTDVRAAPTTDVRAASATDVRAAPSNTVRAAPATYVRAHRHEDRPVLDNWIQVVKKPKREAQGRGDVRNDNKRGGRGKQASYASTSDGHNLITAMHVQYGTSCRDHIPLIVDISIESVPVLEDTVNDTTLRVDWDKLSVEDKAAYVNNTDTILSSVRVPIEAICCKDVICENQSHRDELGIFLKRVGGCHVCG